MYLSLLPVGKLRRWMTLCATPPQTRPMMNFRIKGRDGIARVTGHNVGQCQTDGTGQTAGNAVQQQGGQRREGVAQMKAGPGAQHIRDAAKTHMRQSSARP